MAFRKNAPDIRKNYPVSTGDITATVSPGNGFATASLDISLVFDPKVSLIDVGKITGSPIEHIPIVIEAKKKSSKKIYRGPTLKGSRLIVSIRITKTTPGGTFPCTLTLEGGANGKKEFPVNVEGDEDTEEVVFDYYITFSPDAE